MKRKSLKSTTSSSKVVSLGDYHKETQKDFGKHSNTSRDMALISPTLLATAFLAISVPIFLLTIPLNGLQPSSTKNQKEEKSELLTLCEALGIE